MQQSTRSPKPLVQQYRTPLLIAVTLGIGIVGFITNLIAGFIPIIGNFFGQAIFATLTTGILGMAAYNIAENRKGTLNDYGTTLSDHGLSVFGAILIEQLIYFITAAIGVIMFIFTVGLGSGLTAGVQENPGEVASAAAATGLITFLIIGVFILIFIGLGLFLQFLELTIIIDDESVISAISASFTLAKNNIVSVLGYSLARFGTILAVSAVFIGIIMISAAISETLALVLGVFIGLPLIPVSGAFFYAYHAHYYTELTGRTIA